MEPVAAAVPILRGEISAFMVNKKETRPAKAERGKDYFSFLCYIVFIAHEL